MGFVSFFLFSFICRRSSSATPRPGKNRKWTWLLRWSTTTESAPQNQLGRSFWGTMHLEQSYGTGQICWLPREDLSLNGTLWKIRKRRLAATRSKQLTHQQLQPVRHRVRIELSRLRRTHNSIRRSSPNFIANRSKFATSYRLYNRFNWLYRWLNVLNLLCEAIPTRRSWKLNF